MGFFLTPFLRMTARIRTVMSSSSARCQQAARGTCSPTPHTSGFPESSVMTDAINLPEPSTSGEMSVPQAIKDSASRRSYRNEGLSLDQLGQILWSAQGATRPEEGKRAAPSAGATYPMELFVAVGHRGVEGLEAGIYRYDSESHSIEKTHGGDLRSQISSAALGQEFLSQAPISLLLAANYNRTTQHYGERGKRYVHMEVGHIGQNVYLQAEGMGLATVAVGAFRDDTVANIFGLPAPLEPLYLMPVGYSR